MKDYWEFGPARRRGESEKSYTRRLEKWASRKYANAPEAPF